MINITGGITSLCWLAFLLYWLGSFILFPTKRTVERQSLWWRIVPIVIIFLIITIARNGTAMSVYLNIILWPQTLVSGIVADIVCLVGISIMIWARTVLGRNWSSTVVFKENHELITSGPYAYVRHPIYTGLILLSLGTAIYYGQLASVIFFILFSLFFWLRSLQEERLMEKHFPETYPAYKEITKALIPYIF